MPLCNRGCGKQIVFGIDEHGTKHPLDLVPPTFRVMRTLASDNTTLEVARTNAAGGVPIVGHVYVSHFATCPALRKPR